jgi:glycosyltransferase involved in cell wall biosynthesis
MKFEALVHMRILQVYMGPYQVDRGGGISVYVRNISERLARRHDVTVFATNPGNLSRFEVVNGVKVERFRRYAPGRAYFFSLEMLLRLRKVDFDVVHGHGYQAFPLHFSTLAKRKKFIASTHYHGVGHSVFRNSLMRVFRPVGKRTLNAADKIVAVSEYEKSILNEQFKLDPGRVAVIPCGVDFREFENLKRHRHCYRSVLYVGRLESYKGAQYLLEVLPKLGSDWIMEIVGKGPVKPLLEKRARELGILQRVRFYQELPRKQLLERFADADVFVLLSRYEAYSIAVAEAMVAGTPCIVAKGSALTEWIDGTSCFGIEYPIEIDQLAQLIERVSRYKKEPARLELKADKIKDWNYVVNKIEEVYTE